MWPQLGDLVSAWVVTRALETCPNDREPLLPDICGVESVSLFVVPVADEVTPETIGIYCVDGPHTCASCDEKAVEARLSG